jgi:hypothetical protein
VDNPILEENCFGLPIILELIQTGPYTLNDPEQIKDTVTGSCTLTLTDNSISCYNNHTENQCRIRSAEKSASTSKWIKGSQCASVEAPLSNGKKSTPATRKTITIPGNRLISSAPSRGLDTGTNQPPSIAVD